MLFLFNYFYHSKKYSPRKSPKSQNFKVEEKGTQEEEITQEEEVNQFERVSDLYTYLIQDWLDLDLTVCIDTLPFFFQEPEVLQRFFQKFSPLPSLSEENYLKILEAAWFYYRVTHDIQLFQEISSKKAGLLPRENPVREDLKMLSLYFADKKNKVEAIRVAFSGFPEVILDPLIEKLAKKWDYQEILSAYFESKKEAYKIYDPETLEKLYDLDLKLLAPVLAKHCKVEEVVVNDEFNRRVQSSS